MDIHTRCGEVMALRPRVMIVDDEPDLGSLLKLFLGDVFDVDVFCDPREACAAVNQNQYALVVTDIKMPFLSGLEVAKYVKKASAMTEVVLITGHAHSEVDRQQAAQSGAAGILFKPFGDPARLVQCLEGVLAGRGMVSDQLQKSCFLKPSILIIDDDRDVMEVISMLLMDEYEVFHFTDPVDAISCCTEREYGCILTDLSMPQMSGIELIQEIRNRLPETPILIMSGHSKTDKIVRDAFKAGAVDLVTKPFPNTETILALMKRYIK